ncbi:DivIVA domain-containing protein [Actinoplanes philippinensis]|uniref:DivIVA domain-containing protein n=2 Tax=Actinoplanes philippinensis TaxID=35752 RepID=A0A1I2CPA1_9ACTN|nr:DivIVA domain-containing protein [Actinoplanes philippinensis]
MSAMRLDFTFVLRGYDRSQVDALLGRASAALDAEDASQRARAREALQTADFTIVLRGYDRAQVDGAVQMMLRELDAAPSEDLRATLASVLRLPDADDQLIIDEVRRLRALADLHRHE